MAHAHEAGDCIVWMMFQNVITMIPCGKRQDTAEGNDLFPGTPENSGGSGCCFFEGMTQGGRYDETVLFTACSMGVEAAML